MFYCISLSVILIVQTSQATYTDWYNDKKIRCGCSKFRYITIYEICVAEDVSTMIQPNTSVANEACELKVLGPLLSRLLG